VDTILRFLDFISNFDDDKNSMTKPDYSKLINTSETTLIPGTNDEV